jgi:hypothetical protein
MADHYGDIDPESPYWDALDLATKLECELEEAHREIQRICQKQSDADNEREALSAITPTEVATIMEGRCWKCGASKRNPGKACDGEWATCVVWSCRETKTCLKNDPLPELPSYVEGKP